MTFADKIQDIIEETHPKNTKALEAVLQNGLELYQTMWGMEDGWIEVDKIKYAESYTKLKNLCDKHQVPYEAIPSVYHAIYGY